MHAPSRSVHTERDEAAPLSLCALRRLVQRCDLTRPNTARGVQLLMNLAADSQNRKVLREAGACEALVCMMKVAPLDSTMEQAMGALHNVMLTGKAPAAPAAGTVVPRWQRRAAGLAPQGPWPRESSSACLGDAACSGRAYAAHCKRCWWVLAVYGNTADSKAKGRAVEAGVAYGLARVLAAKMDENHVLAIRARMLLADLLRIPDMQVRARSG